MLIDAHTKSSDVQALSAGTTWSSDDARGTYDAAKRAQTIGIVCLAIVPALLIAGGVLVGTSSSSPVGGCRLARRSSRGAELLMMKPWRRNCVVVLVAAGLASFGACVASDFVDADSSHAIPPARRRVHRAFTCAHDGRCRMRDLADGEASDVALDSPVSPAIEGGGDGALVDASDASDACATATWTTIGDA